MGWALEASLEACAFIAWSCALMLIVCNLNRPSLTDADCSLVDAGPGSHRRHSASVNLLEADDYSAWRGPAEAPARERAGPPVRPAPAPPAATLPAAPPPAGRRGCRNCASPPRARSCAGTPPRPAPPERERCDFVGHPTGPTGVLARGSASRRANGT